MHKVTKLIITHSYIFTSNIFHAFHLLDYRTIRILEQLLQNYS